MPRQLKVYRTPVGFDDAYVAASSQAAALRAWGTDKNLFARGAAEVVTDAELTREPLASPGKVILKRRGDLAAQLKALGPRPKRKPAAAPEQPELKRKAKPPPRPSRAKLDKAERELAAAEKRHAAELQALRDKEAALARERSELRRKQDTALHRLQAARDAAREGFAEAMRQWANDQS